eukprot:2940393-Prymnesium_polylepis.1
MSQDCRALALSHESPDFISESYDKNTLQTYTCRRDATGIKNKPNRGRRRGERRNKDHDIDKSTQRQEEKASANGR